MAMVRCRFMRGQEEGLLHACDWVQAGSACSGGAHCVAVHAHAEIMRGLKAAHPRPRLYATVLLMTCAPSPSLVIEVATPS